MLLHFALSGVFWLALGGLLAWGLGHLLARLQQAQPAPIVAQPAEEPSAVELLRRRYVLGEIDADTFDAMLSHLLASQERPIDML
jgi:hypothetical protein